MLASPWSPPCCVSVFFRLLSKIHFFHTVLANVEEQVAERYKVLIEQMSQREETSEKLKEENQMEWVRRMNNLENRAAEIIKAELIYTFERR